MPYTFYSRPRIRQVSCRHNEMRVDMVMEGIGATQLLVTMGISHANFLDSSMG